MERCCVWYCVIIISTVPSTVVVVVVVVVVGAVEIMPGSPVVALVPVLADTPLKVLLDSIPS